MADQAAETTQSEQTGTQTAAATTNTGEAASQQTAAATAPKTLLGGREPTPEKTAPLADGGEGVVEPVKGDWPDDWRDKLADGDEDTAKLLKRFGSPKAVARALRETRAQVSKGLGAAAEPPENASDEQKAEWRKARGVPDKPEEYKFDAPKDHEWTDSDREYLTEFGKFAHAKGWSQAQAKDAVDWYMNDQIARLQDQEVAARNRGIETEKALKAEYGKDYSRTVEMVRSYGQEQIGADDWDKLVNMRLSDGSYLGDQPALIKLLATAARDLGDGTPFEAGTSAGGVSDGDLMKAHKELVSKSVAGDKDAKRKLADPEYDRRITAAYERQARAAERNKKAAA
jgi:hypothetical protein